MCKLFHPMPHPNYQSSMNGQNRFTPREKNNSRNEANLLVNIGITNICLDLIMHTGHHSPQWMLDESDKWGSHTSSTHQRQQMLHSFFIIGFKMYI
jgi:hypothetical protein